MPNDPAANPHRIERVLVVMGIAVIGISVVAIVVLLGLAAAGVPLGSGAGTSLRLVPLIGLPVGMLLLIGFVVASAVRRTRAG